MLKLYVACMGWKGSAVAIAHSKEEAIQMMMDNHERFGEEHHKYVEEFAFQQGYVAGDSGDA